MHKLNLKMFELQTLLYELRGVSQEKVSLKGLLNQKLSLVLKYDLNKLANTVQSEVENFMKLRDELIKELGVQTEDGNFSVPMYLNEEKKEVNPNFKKFISEIGDIQNKDVEISFPNLKLEQFESLETEEYYEVFFKCLENIRGE